jgi:DNA-binding NarL/FixJ family response regulator
MKNSPIKILLCDTVGERNRFLTKMFNEKGYQVETLEKIEPVIDKLQSNTVDLVICANNINEYSGFEVFNILKKYLRHSGIPFFLILESFEKEIMMVGLELGIDNFIFTPINKTTVFYKIENQINKRDELNIFDSFNFKDYFHSSLVAMFFVTDNKIDSVNKAFCKLNNACSNKILERPVDGIFNIYEDKGNELNYRRFQNGITNECQLKNVKCYNNSSIIYDINFYRGNNQGATHIFAEIIPSAYKEIIVNQNDTIVQEFDDIKITSSGLGENQNSEIKLTSREQHVFELSARGIPIKIIAGKLGLSERTVEKHRANIMAKANAKNMIEAIACIQKYGAVSQFWNDQLN